MVAIGTCLKAAELANLHRKMNVIDFPMIKCETANKPLKTPRRLLEQCRRNYYERGGRERLAEHYRNLSPEKLQERKLSLAAWKERNPDRVRVLRWAANCKARVRRNPAVANFDVWKMIACDCGRLPDYLDAQCEPGVDWRDGRSVHIDHIRPLHTFDLSDPLQLRECLHFTNLQVLKRGIHERKSGVELDREAHLQFMDGLARSYWAVSKTGEYPGFREGWNAFTYRFRTQTDSRSAPRVPDKDKAAVARENDTNK